MGCIAGIFFTLLGIGLLLIYGEFCIVQGGWRYCAYAVGIALITVLILCIIKLIKWIISKHPTYIGIKAMKLKEAQKLDEKNKQLNQANKEQAEAKAAADKEKRIKQIDLVLPELVENFNEAKDEFEESMNDIRENDCLGEDEKNIQVVEMLIYFIESRRADSIKEALHEYDKAKANQQMIELEEKRLAMQKTQMEKEARDREKMLQLQEEANNRARWAAMDDARQREQLLQKLGSLETMALADYYKNHF